MIVAVWYGIVAFMLATYVALDGRNFGAGIVQRIIAKEPLERRQIVAAIGPLWLWHEVWLVGVGGVLFVAFPRLLASAFAGYYLAMFLILWSATLRGVSLELEGHIDDRLWQSFWDTVLFLSSALLAILFGVALGNLIRGVPLHRDGTFHMAFFSDFRPRGEVGLLDWYTGAIGLFCAFVLIAHGATFLAQKTEGIIHDRAALLCRRLWVAIGPGFFAISILTWLVRPDFFAGLMARPLAWLGATLALVSAALLASGLYRGAYARAFLGSSLLIQAVVMTGAAALYPTMLLSTLDPANSLTAEAAASSHSGLVAALVWWPVAAILAVVYFFSVFRHYRGKVGIPRNSDIY